MRQPVPFGKYLLLDRISVGGMAEVFKAKSYGVEGFEKIIAIKRILPTMGEDRDFIKMFIDEAKIAGQLAHANICQIFELGRIDGSHFIAMEYIWGKDLLQIQNRLRKIKQPMPIPMACFVIAKVLEGLDYAHRKRDPLGRPLEIVHRDCSPQNVLVSYEGEVKIIDFGIAKATSRNSRTMAGVLKGKFGYMSPEQVRGLPLDRRSDIFALGTMLYECLTGDRLFQGETDFSTLEKVRNVDIRPPRELNPNIPPAVEAVILKALAKDVEERYQWCSEMLADLQAFLMAQEVVFTAKSLSSWLKEVFATEIDRERQQLEQYKRVGRDGLIDGVPAAEAKLNIVETLGEAGPLEGDPTVLGTPNFDDIEQAAGAAPEVGPVPGSPAVPGGGAPDDDDDEAFGEEAPTEIFGEIDHGAKPATPPRAASRPGSSPPQTRPPRPPPSNRPPTSRGDAVVPLAASPSMQQPRPPSARPGEPPPAAPQSGLSLQSYANPANAGAPYPGFGQPAPSPHAMAPGPQAMASSHPIALGIPGIVPPHAPQPGNGVVPAASPGGRTLLGTSPPPNLSSYAQGYPPQFGGYHGQPPMPGTHGAMPPGAMPPGMMPPGAMPSGRFPGAYVPPQGPYTTPNPYAAAAAPPEPAPSQEGMRRSSIARDVAIGVALAGVVLGGFLAVKFLVLDGESTMADSTAPPSIATIRLAMAADEHAKLYIDDTLITTVSDKREITVPAGQRKVKLVGENGMACAQDMTLPAGKTTLLECPLTPAGADHGATPTVGPGSGAAGSGAQTASAPGTGSGSAASAATPSTPAPGSATAPPSTATAPPSTATGDKPDAKPADHPGPDKADKMPIEEKLPPGKPANQAAAKPAIKPADKPAPHVADKPVAKPVIERPRPQPADDDLLGKLHGGSKPGEARPADAKAAELKKPGDKPDDKQPAHKPGDARGYLALISKSTGKVIVDGVDTGLSTPISGHSLPLSPGKHKVTFVIPGYKETFSVQINAGETTTVQKDL